MKLRYMLTGSDEEFAQRVREALERRARFEAGEGVVETFSDASETSEEEQATEAVCQSSMQVDQTETSEKEQATEAAVCQNSMQVDQTDVIIQYFVQNKEKKAQKGNSVAKENSEG